MNTKVTIILILFGALLLMIGLFFALKSLKPINFNLIAGLIILIGTFFGLFGKQLQDKYSSDKSDRILNTSENNAKNIEKLKEKIEDQAKIIDNLRTENTLLYSKLADKTMDIYHNITGGNSYCIMVIASINNNIGLLGFELGAGNKYPLKGLSARVVDLNDFDKEKIDISLVLKNILSIGDINPNEMKLTAIKVKLDKDSGVNLNIFFNANNGFFHQLLRMRFIKDHWSRATKIIRDDQCIFIKIDNDYPEKDENDIFN